MDWILHLVPASEFHACDGAASYVPRQFEKDGFIHCAVDAAVLLQVANRFYRQVSEELLVLVIDPARVAAQIRYEPPGHPDGTPATSDETRLFPHIYGPLEREAIVSIRTALRAPDGFFRSV